MNQFNAEYFLGVGKAVVTVLVVGVLFGAGLPALFAAGLNSLYGGEPEVGGVVAATKNPARIALAWAAFALVIALIAFGILVIIFGKPLLQAVGLV
ncbi:hypothetical protein [Segniliparus rugosus]|uniref:Uncharacterized protein n=1 Tax=Segniliparus rugosus (strain ATCC BAA-974 / DSM 45345 / CCUG 50838 / CIP 108380 / JCM 13579 / CDC 945) TaxID=679197 RepID=E5XRD4_SEGRC|nr:hypothetical protein [Segniliparus rugosus]EFV13104.1 hypothetical protein HMPREF9336_02056 [Segniliparus rugosus ATCC BAA-974]